MSSCPRHGHLEAESDTPECGADRGAASRLPRCLGGNRVREEGCCPGPGSDLSLTDTRIHVSSCSCPDMGLGCGEWGARGSTFREPLGFRPYVLATLHISPLPTSKTWSYLVKFQKFCGATDWITSDTDEHENNSHFKKRCWVSGLSPFGSCFPFNAHQQSLCAVSLI